MKLALGPILYYWDRDTMLGFYEEISDAPVDIIYLGETVCSRRHLLRLQDYLDMAERLVAAGKEVVISTQTLIESENDVKTLRKIADNGNFKVEANDMGAVRLLANKVPFVAGSTLNVYNPQTLDLLAGLGATRWVIPVEMSQEALAAVLRERQSKSETEVFAYGRLPLAFSARCFTARHYNLQKDDCQFKCLDYEDGLTLKTREGQPFLNLNGIQTQSALVYNLIGELDTLQSTGADVVRISPQAHHTGEILHLFRECMEQRLVPAQAMSQVGTLMPAASCNGYWHGKPGLDFILDNQLTAAENPAAVPNAL
ncbi:MAG: U32 family peptidase [Gallionellales bacterium GWA2_55_18]|nr:MAG: U32 family peptidase [Gallionellales bacterium GWA2_55_18]